MLGTLGGWLTTFTPWRAVKEARESKHKDMECLDAELLQNGNGGGGGAGDLRVSERSGAYVVLADEAGVGLVEAALQVVGHLDAELNGRSSRQGWLHARLVHNLQLRHVGERVPRDPPVLDACVHIVDAVLRVTRRTHNHLRWTVDAQSRRTVEEEGEEPRLGRERHLHVGSLLLVGLRVLDVMRIAIENGVDAREDLVEVSVYDIHRRVHESRVKVAAVDHVHLRDVPHSHIGIVARRIATRSVAASPVNAHLLRDTYSRYAPFEDTNR